MNNAEGDISLLQSSSSSNSTNISTLQGQASSLETRMTGAEGEISTLQSDLSALELSIVPSKGTQYYSVALDRTPIDMVSYPGGPDAIQGFYELGAQWANDNVPDFVYNKEITNFHIFPVETYDRNILVNFNFSISFAKPGVYYILLYPNTAGQFDIFKHTAYVENEEYNFWIFFLYNFYDFILAGVKNYYSHS